jgi:hypothetical protein
VKHLSVLCSLVMLAVGMAACGSATKEALVASSSTRSGERSQAPSHALPPGQTVKSDGDADNPKDVDGNPDSDTTDLDDDSYTPGSYLYPDADDRATLAYGEPPSPAERTEIADVVTRYYAAAATADGATACSLLLPSLARGVPRDYGSGAGPTYLRGGKTCAAVMARLFEHSHAELVVPAKLLSIRAKGAVAQVVLGSRVLPASLVGLRRQERAWRLVTLLGSPLP